MDLSAIIKAVLEPLETRGLGDWLKDLQTGDKLTGRVISIESDGRVLVDLGRSRVLAQIAFAVKPGQSLNLQVVETGPVLHFRVENPQNALLSMPLPQAEFSQVLTPVQREQLIQLIDRVLARPDNGQHQNVIQRVALDAFTQIRTLFEDMPMERPVDQIAMWIKGAVEDRGIWFEKRLADTVAAASPPPMDEKQTESVPPPATALITRDIKPHLMMLSKSLTEEGDQHATALKLSPKEIEFIRHSIDRLISHIEQQQERAVARWQTGESSQVLVHAWPLPDQPAPVQLKLYYPKTRKRDEGIREHRIALLLDMDRLGPVRADLAMIGAHLHISFFVGSEALKTLFRDAVQAVVEALAETFPHLEIDIFVSREKIAQFHQEDAKGAAAGRVDLKA